MKKILLAFCAGLILTSCDLSQYRLVEDYDFTTVFEHSEGTKTATYQKTVQFYQDLDEAFSSISVRRIGMNYSV